MSDVVVHLSVENSVVENELAATLSAFLDKNPLVKTTYSGEDFIRKAITFQDRASAKAFLDLWRQKTS